MASAPHSDRQVAEIILKVRSRCNLACDYCYVYELRDTGWRHQPVAMDMDMISRIASECARYRPQRLRVLFHGGEPLLAGAQFLAQAAAVFRAALPQVTFGLQTNGTLLTEPALAILQQAQIGIGLSMDAGQQTHDQHRRYPNGQPSWAKVRDAAMLLGSRYRDIYGGILSVIDPDTDPLAAYTALAELKPPALDFLLPLATWDHPPSHGGQYGSWLAAVFDHWQRQPASQAPRIRLFEVIIARLLGADRRVGFLGPQPDQTSIVIQPDGSTQILDSVYVVADGAADTGLNIWSSSLAQIAAHPGFTQPAPAASCLTCPVFSVCGGGYWPTRYRTASQYANPSVHCPDYLHLITHIKSELSAVTGLLAAPVPAPRPAH